MQFSLFFSQRRVDRDTGCGTEKETCLVGSLCPTCEEGVGRDPVAPGREAAVSSSGGDEL